MLGLDTSRWERVRFGDVVRNVNESVRDVAEAGIDRIIALEHLDPGEVTIQRYGDAAEGTTFTRRVRPGQTLFGKRRAYQRKAAYAEVDAVCSGDILVFEALPGRLSSRLLPFLVHSAPFFDHAVGTSAGSLSPRTSWKALATFEFDLPPLDEQERLADLLWATHRHRVKARDIVSASAASASCDLRIKLDRPNGRICSIRDLCREVVGGIWGHEAGVSEVDVLALGPRVYRSDSVFIDPAGSPWRSISSKQAASRLIRPGDIVLERSGGSADQAVGRVVLAGAELPPCVPTDFQRLLRPDTDQVLPEYLYWRLRLDREAGKTLRHSRKTTNITNLDVPAYLARQISVPSLQDQTKLVESAQASTRSQSRLEHEVLAITELAATLNAALFGGH